MTNPQEDKINDVLKLLHEVSRNPDMERAKELIDEGIGNIRNAGFQPHYNAYFLLKFLEKLLRHVKIQNAKTKIITQNSKLQGKTFVFTGTLDLIERESAKEKVRNLGGQVSESVSVKTSFVVVGANPGSKAGKAKKLGVKTLDEKEFLKLLE